MEQRSAVGSREEEEIPQLANALGDDNNESEVTTATERKVSESTSADENTESEITSSDEKDVVQTDSAGENTKTEVTSSDEKEVVQTDSAGENPQSEATSSDEKEVVQTDSAGDELEPDVTNSDEKKVSGSASGVDEIEVATLNEEGASESSSAHEGVTESAREEEEEEDEEDEEECGFCLFMKKGPCGDRFKFWQDCVEGAEKAQKDIVEQCAQTTTLLKVCMEMNSQYYGPVLDAERAMEADLAATEESNTDGAESSDSLAKAEEVVETESGEQIVETTDVVGVVVGDEGQVVETVHVVDVEAVAA